MVKFIELAGTYNYKWGFKNYDNCTRYNTCSLKGSELVEWLQKYGVEPNEMFKGKELRCVYDKRDYTVDVDKYDIYNKAEEWLSSHSASSSWTCVGMNGGYVIMSDADKSNVVELGSAPAKTEVNINNSSSSSSSCNPEISVHARASLL